MGTRESYEPGTFSWAELATTDAEAAKTFYTTLFGWEFEDMETGGPVYSMASILSWTCGLHSDQQRCFMPKPIHRHLTL